MPKAVDAFRTISEVADELEIPKHVLRFWEGKFSQIRPMKRGGGRRYYRPEDMELLRGIKQLLHGQGFTIRGVQRILREQGVEHVKGSGRDPQAGSAKPVDLVTAPVRAEKAAGANRGRASFDRDHWSILEGVLRELEACRKLLEQPLGTTAADEPPRRHVG